MEHNSTRKTLCYPRHQTKNPVGQPRVSSTLTFLTLDGSYWLKKPHRGGASLFKRPHPRDAHEGGVLLGLSGRNRRIQLFAMPGTKTQNPIRFVRDFENPYRHSYGEEVSDCQCDSVSEEAGHLSPLVAVFGRARDVVFPRSVNLETLAEDRKRFGRRDMVSFLLSYLS